MAIKGRELTAGAVGIAAGALIGAGIALLAAPKSGRETRRDIARLGKKARREVGALADDFSGKVEGVMRTMEGTAREIVEKGRGAAEGTSRALKSVVEEGRSVIGRHLVS